MNVLLALVLAQVGTAVQPVVAFPEPGLDDSAAYEGYSTRFFRDAAGNVVQIYLNRESGRVVHLWADAANASAGFTVRDGSGRPAPLAWADDAGVVGDSSGFRSLRYRLRAGPAPLRIGGFLLGSMRLEREFQYADRHLEPFGPAGIEQPELLELIAHLEMLDAAERRRQLELLRAASVAELRSRLRPSVHPLGASPSAGVRVRQPTLDGRNLLLLDIRAEGGDVRLEDSGHTLIVEAPAGEAVELVVTIATDAPTLSPLRAEEIFNAAFLRFYGDAQATAAGEAAGVSSASSPAESARRLERQIRSTELVSYEEKLMAGLPNFATYFGRDMMMSALMMEPIWSHAMLEHVIASVLRKLAVTGEVSHEEALGGQAVRENAAAYNELLRERRAAAAEGRTARADSLLAAARAVLADLQAVRESYHMVDDDFQLPVLAARYLAHPEISAERKRAFLLEVEAGQHDSRLDRLLLNLAFVARQAEPYARDPRPLNLIGFHPRPEGGWSSGSWRDSGAGYADGRFAMDVNAIWVPEALAAIESILRALPALGFDPVELAARPDRAGFDVLATYAADAARLTAATTAWSRAREHFMIALSAAEVHGRMARWLDALPEPERAYWAETLDRLSLETDSLRFPAVALDSAGAPIAVMNTDAATRLFLVDISSGIVAGRGSAREAVAELRPFLLEYPVGLLVPGLGPLVANDAYASPRVWRRFREDLYHSPRVVWGREVNLLLLGLSRQLAIASDLSQTLEDPRLEPYVRSLTDALARTLAAVDASGLQHNELWSYRIEDGRLLPVRYGTSSDIQLWNLTDLAVRFALSRLPAAVRPAPR